MKLLITGGTGFVGKHLCLKLQTLGLSFSCIIRPQTDIDFLEKNNINFYIFDGNLNSLDAYLKEECFDGVIHLSSLFIAEHVPEHIDELIMSNILFGTKLLEASVKNNIKWFINTGTFWQHYQGEVYNPVNLYAATKQSFEVIAKYYTETYGIKFISLKLNDTYGENDTRRKIFNLWDEIALSGKPLAMSPGEQLIDIVHVSDVIEAYVKLIHYMMDFKKEDIQNMQTFYVSSGRHITLKNLAKEYEKKYNVKLNIIWGGRPYRKREVMKPQCIGQNINDL